MYMAGRLRTASNPSSTWILLAEYSPALTLASELDSTFTSSIFVLVLNTQNYNNYTVFTNRLKGYSPRRVTLYQKSALQRDLLKLTAV